MDDAITKEGLPPLDLGERSGITLQFDLSHGNPVLLVVDGTSIHDLAVYNNNVVCEVDLERGSNFTVKVEGKSAGGVDLAVSGEYVLDDGPKTRFAGGKRGDPASVTLPHGVTCSDPRTHIAVNAFAEEGNGAKHEYDPLVILTPKKGQCAPS